MSTAAAAPPVEREIVFDIAKRGLIAAPAIIAIAAVVRGGAGAASATVAVVIVILNLALSGAALSWAARTSLNLLMVACRLAGGTPMAEARPPMVHDWYTRPASYQDWGSGSVGSCSWNR